MKKFTLLLLVTALILGGLSASCGSAPVEEPFKKGVTLFNEGQLDEAIVEFTKAIEIDPNHAWAYVNRANAYAEKGEYKKAMTDLEKVLDLSKELSQEAKERLDAAEGKLDAAKELSQAVGQLIEKLKRLM